MRINRDLLGCSERASEQVAFKLRFMTRMEPVMWRSGRRENAKAFSRHKLAIFPDPSF